MGLPSEAIDWLRAQPPEIQAVMRRFPPSCFVRTRDGVQLQVPREGRIGQVHAYRDDGTITVADDGTRTCGVCSPDDLVLVGYWNDISTSVVAAVLDSASETPEA